MLMAAVSPVSYAPPDLYLLTTQTIIPSSSSPTSSTNDVAPDAAEHRASPALSEPFHANGPAGGSHRMAAEDIRRGIDSARLVEVEGEARPFAPRGRAMKKGLK